MKTWHWIVIGIIILLIVVYAVWAYNKNQELKKKEEEERANNPAYTPTGSSKVAEILNALFPFFKEIA